MNSWVTGTGLQKLIGYMNRWVVGTDGLLEQVGLLLQVGYRWRQVPTPLVPRL